LGERIAILCKKGFEIMDLSESESIDISHPDQLLTLQPTVPKASLFHTSTILATRNSLNGAGHLAQWAYSAPATMNSSFVMTVRTGPDTPSTRTLIITFTEFGLYINKYGDVNPTKGPIEWEVIADHVACHPPYVFIFDACHIEVRHIESGRLCQIINGQSLRCTWNGYGSSVPLFRPDPDGMEGETPVPGTSVCGVMRTDHCPQGPSPSRVEGAAVQCVFELVPTVFHSLSLPMITCAPNLDGPP
jgi:CNH domain